MHSLLTCGYHALVEIKPRFTVTKKTPSAPVTPIAVPTPAPSAAQWFEQQMNGLHFAQTPTGTCLIDDKGETVGVVVSWQVDINREGFGARKTVRMEMVLADR